MTAREVWEAACAGKEPYTSEASAEFVLARIRQEKGTQFKACWLETYKCRFCGDWHIGHCGKVA